MCCLLSKYHSDVIFRLWSMDIDWQVPSLCTDSSLGRNQQVQNHSNTRSSCAITLKIKPTTMSWSRCCFKKKSRKLCITNKYKYKIHNKIYPIQHSARSGKRCIEVTNRDEYKNITTRNVVVFRCPSWTSRLIRWHYKPIAAIRLLCPSWLSANYNRCPWWTRGYGVIHPSCSVINIYIKH